MFLYLSAFIFSALDRKKIAKTIFAVGFLSAFAAFICRWFDAAHIPFQNMFEIFLSMGVLIYPISIFCKRKLAAPGQTFDMLLGVVLLFPAGFIFTAGKQMLPPALQSPFFIPHIAAYLIAYVIMTKAALTAFRGFSTHAPDSDELTYNIVSLGFPLLTLGLVLGSWWGKIAWGDYWAWDPKELWSLATWLIYLFYFHFRSIFGKKYPKINNSLVLAGLAAIIITLLWVNLSRLFPGLHNYAS
jgi:ABC-type transport system involved in cytochrome c biogenesis permease subunit